jgi:Xaa-Pro dipeptidase
MPATHPTTTAEAELRALRRQRVFDAMAAAGLDVLVLGRRDSVAYATGARSLWTASTRQFGAACVLVSATGSTHLLSTWDAGVPPEIAFEHLYGITWNPATMAATLSAIPGLPEARLIGVDALSPGFERAARRLAPLAELVPADNLLWAVRVTKLSGEVERIRAAVAVAAAGVEAASDALASGAMPGEARAAAVRTAAARGATVPSSGVVLRGRADRPAGGRLTVRNQPRTPSPTARPPSSTANDPAAKPPSIGPHRGDLSADVLKVDPAGRRVQVDVGLLVDGYEGGRGRTVRQATSDREDGGSTAAVAAQQRLLDACRPGATAHDLRNAAGGARWMVRGCGMGFEPPVVTAELGDEVVLEADMVLSVELELNGWRRRDLLLVGPGATEVL